MHYCIHLLTKQLPTEKEIEKILANNSRNKRLFHSALLSELKRNEERKAVGYLTKENINDIIKVQSEEEEDAGQSD